MGSRKRETAAERTAGESGRIDSDSFRRAMSRLPTGVTVVTALGEGGPSGLTANAVLSLSLDPPLMLAALDRGSRTLRTVEVAGRFGVNVLAAGQAELARSFSTKLGMQEKWDGVAWRERGGIPALDGIVVWVACEIRDVLQGGDHVILTGAVLDVQARDADPLIFYRGAYMALGEAP
jgi:flavin reductase (DIM6/NTAB) family NADH-FMN oxidoreductase RutF